MFKEDYITFSNELRGKVTVFAQIQCIANNLNIKFSRCLSLHSVKYTELDFRHTILPKSILKESLERLVSSADQGCRRIFFA